MQLIILINLINSYISGSHSLISEKQRTKRKKLAEDLNRHFPARRHIDGQKHMKRCSTWLIIREMQIKIISKYHFTPVRMAIIKKSTNNKSWRGCSENELSCTVDRDANRCSHYGKHYGYSYKN